MKGKIHRHTNIFLGRKIDDNHGGFFSWIECKCGLTGINDNGKTIWNERNLNRDGVLIKK